MDPLPVVRDNPAANRYELWLGDVVVGFAEYARTDGVVTVPHVGTDPAHRGNGYAALLMDGLIDDLRARSFTIRPLCPYAANYMNDRPDTHDLYA
jgi:uncharacterized protein